MNYYINQSISYLIFNFFSSSSKSSGSVVSLSSLSIKLFFGCFLNGNECQAVLAGSGVGGPGPVLDVELKRDLVVGDSLALGGGKPGGVLGKGGLCGRLEVGAWGGTDG